MSDPVPAEPVETETTEVADGLDYVERASSAFMQALGSVPSTLDITTEMLAALTLLVLVRGDRATASDVHDARAVLGHDDPVPASVMPFAMLDPREQQGLDVLADAVRRAGRYVGRDGS